MPRKDRVTCRESYGFVFPLSITNSAAEYLLDYLKHSFPTKVFETKTDKKGHKYSEPMVVDGNYVESQEAVQRRDRLLERLQSLPPIQSALDQLIQHFGTDKVAEITGRKRRIVKKPSDTGTVLAVESRSASSNLAEAQAFMDDEKNILIFSDAGGTGRSYHADIASRNQRQRIHYLLEPGWKADNAIQGLGRSNRTNQKQPPIFRPVTTNVKGERRFISTIARRLDRMGAITRGERRTGGQGLFRPEDNLENDYAWSARREFFRLLVAGKVACCSYQQFKDATGLNLTDGDSTLREDLPPMHTLLNRLLALRIEMQNQLFEVLEGLIVSRVEAAMAAGTYDVGLETITAESLTIASRHTIATFNGGAGTAVYEVRRKHRPRPFTLTDALAEREYHRVTRLLYNPRSKRAALEIPAPSITLEDGTIQDRIRLLRPMETHTMDIGALEDTLWQPCDHAIFSAAWEDEISTQPKFVQSSFHVITGMLLPIWKRIDSKNPRVYRFITDDGERVIGRVISQETAARLVGVTKTFNATEAWAWLQTGMSLPLEEDLTIKERLVMHAKRLEVTGYNHGQLDWLKAQGCITEIITHRLRLFLPAGDNGPAILARIMARYPHRPAEAAHAA